jgi:antitoxin VapB
MPLQIANPVVVDKVEKLAKATGLSKTALVERAVDLLQRESRPVSTDRLQALLVQLDRVPDRADANNPLQWDALGLPR